MKESFFWMDRERMGGVPCFYGTRVPLENLFDYLEAGASLAEFLDDFPGVTKEKALAAMAAARRSLFAGGLDRVAA